MVSDGLACFNAVTDMSCEHEVHIVGSGPESVEHPAFHWVNTMLGNVKNALRGTYSRNSSQASSPLSRRTLLSI